VTWRRDDDELRALLAPRMRMRTRFVAIERPHVPALHELAPATDHPDEPALIAALDEDARLVYADWLEQHGAVERAHWVRIYPDGDFLVRTRFGGTPAALRGEPWPRCTCGDALRFVGQVSGADAAEPTWFGLVTFFCWHCCRYGEQDCGGAERPYRGWLLRAYPRGELDAFERLAAPGETFRDGFVAGVHEKSLPHYMHYAEQIVADDVVRLERIADELTDRTPSPRPRNAGLALGGYPYWYNGPDETPACPACKDEMELLVQLDPDEALEASWGDVGTLFAFVCTRHRDMFALRMQCT
jgi:uncharacterized protein (TIGR02996 family)